MTQGADASESKVGTRRRLGQPGRVGLQVLAVAFSPDGQLIASGDADGGIKLWNARGRRRNGTLYHDALEMESSVAFSRGGNTVTACSDFGTLRVRDVASHRMLLDARNIEATTVVSSRDGRVLAIGASDGTIRLLRSRIRESRAKRPSSEPLAVNRSGPGRSPQSAIAD